MSTKLKTLKSKETYNNKTKLIIKSCCALVLHKNNGGVFYSKDHSTF